MTELVPSRPWVGRKAPEVVRSAQDGGAEATWEAPREARQTRKCQGMGVVGAETRAWLSDLGGWFLFQVSVSRVGH